MTLISTETELNILSGEFPEHSPWANYGRCTIVAGSSSIGRVVEVGAGLGKDSSFMAVTLDWKS